jgi:phosphoglycerate dehydrogenase-like enzyme
MKAIFLMREAMFDRVFVADDRARLAETLGEEPTLITPPRFAPELPRLGAVEYIFSGWGCPLLDEHVKAQLPHLRAIFHSAGTVRSIVDPSLWGLGVRVSSATEANALPVADYTFAAVVFAAKYITQHAEAARLGRRYAPPAPMGLGGATVGLMSWSRIGRRVAERLRASGAQVLVYDPYLRVEQAVAQGVVKIDTLEALFARSQIVSCHTPLLPETRGLVRGDHLRRLPVGGHFINTARGAIVAEDELIEVMRERPDLGATIDVTCIEPLPPESPLRDLPNVLLTPHLAGSKDRECRRLGRFAIEEYERLRRGEPLAGEIFRESLAVIA